MCRSRWYQKWVFPPWQLLWKIRKTIKKVYVEISTIKCVHYTTNDLKVLIIHVNASFIRVGNHKQAIVEKRQEIKAYIVNKDMKEFTLKLGDLTDDEREIIIKGCLINYYRG